MQQASWFNTLKLIPQGIWVLSVANFLINVATIITFSFSPLFLIVVFGITTFNLGIIEGIVEGTSWLMRIVSGVVSDYFRRRKVLIIIGYVLVVLTRPLFAFATSVMWVFSGRMIDRIANGLQASPREALTADLCPPNLKGACFGLRQAFGWIGSVCGALLGIFLMHITHDNFRLVFMVGAVPAILAVLLIVFMVKDIKPTAEESELKKNHIKFSDLKALSPAYWSLVFLSAIYWMARFSESFIVLWAKHLGLAVAWAPLVIVIINLTSAFASYPAGYLSDRIDRRFFLCFGLITLIGSDIVFALSTAIPMVLGGAVLWGVQMGITQSLMVTMVADRSPAELRGTAFGIFFLVSGLAMMLASTIAGWLSDHYGRTATFWVSATFGTLALIGLLFISSSKKEKATITA